MPLPHQFVSGNIARSEEVNRNFNYIMTVIGQLSTPGSIQPGAEIVLGPRSTTQLTAEHDVGGNATDFFQISWNAKWTKISNAWRFQRVLSSVGGTAMRIGIRGFEVFATKERTGDIHNQLKSIFRVGDEDGGKFMYLPDDMHITNYNGVPNSTQEMRLTTVILENPIPIYSDAWVGTGTTVLNAFNYGIPKHALAIIIRAHVTAANWSGAGMHFYRHMPSSGGSIKPRTGPQPSATQSLNLTLYRGFVVHASITGTGMGMRAGGQGFVPLGRGPLAGNFVIQRTSTFELANVHIVGYMT